MEKQWLDPDEALQRGTENLIVDQLDAVVEQVVRYGFKLGDFGFMIDPNVLSEVMEPITVYPVPNTAQWMSGLINLRGNLIPVYDLCKLLSLTDNSADLVKPLLLILGQADQTVALLIDGLPKRINTLQALNRLPSLPNLLTEHVTKGYYQDDMIWLEFNHQSFFKAIIARV